jgi:hypothetical protein
MRAAILVGGLGLLLSACDPGPPLPPPGPVPPGLTLALTATAVRSGSGVRPPVRDEYFVDARGRLSLVRRDLPGGAPGELSFSWDQTAVTWREPGPGGTREHVVSWDEDGFLHRSWDPSPSSKTAGETVDRIPKVGQTWGYAGPSAGWTREGETWAGPSGAGGVLRVRVSRGPGFWTFGTLLSGANTLLVALTQEDPGWVAREWSPNSPVP